MACPICEKRKAKRFCPAKAATICSVCCGTEREGTIDCPPDCPYLVASREYELKREHEEDWSRVPFAETKISPAFIEAHEKLFLRLSYALCAYAHNNRLVVDADVLAALGSLAEAYRTLASGIYYERPPDYTLQRGLYEALKSAIEDYKKTETRKTGLVSVGDADIRDGDIRDALIFLAQIGTLRTNGRPKGRAYLYFLGTQFRPGEFARPASNIVLLP